MNKIVKQQLEKCYVAEIPSFDDSTTELIIPMGDKRMKLPHFQLQHYYIIKLEEYLIHPQDNLILHDNWNRGIVPQDKYMKCLVEQFLGKMVKITGVGYDYEHQTDKQSSWEGWLPTDSVEIIKEIL